MQIPFYLCTTTIEKWPRLVFSSTVRPYQIYLASLYHDLYALYGDANSSRLLLYKLSKTNVSCVRSLELMLPMDAHVAFSVVDHLLICHSLELNVSIFFDIKCETSLHDPFSHPLPISLFPPRPESSPNKQNTSQRPPSRHKSISFHSFSRGETDDGDLFQTFEALDGEHGELQPRIRQDSSQYTTHWQFLAPDFAQRVFRLSDRHETSDHIEL